MYMGTHKYNTKIAYSGQIKLEGRQKLELTMSSFKWRVARQFNQLPIELKTLGLWTYSSPRLKLGLEIMWSSEDSKVQVGACILQLKEK